MDLEIFPSSMGLDQSMFRLNDVSGWGPKRDPDGGEYGGDRAVVGSGIPARIALDPALPLIDRRSVT